MAHMMYSQHHATMAPPQKPETFMLSSEAQQSLPQDAQVALQQVDNLKYFLISAPVDWTPDQYIRRFLLPTGEYVSCVLWYGYAHVEYILRNNLFHISGTDIVRCLSFRFQAFGRPVKNSKKFEEGIFSDLRNLKSGTDASLEEPKSGFLDFLYKNNCIRTQKKQKVFYWYSVPHDRLFLDALERDLKREKMGQEATTVAVNEPALSFEFDSSQSLFEQLTKAQQANSSSFSAQQPSYSQSQSQSTSPVMRAMDSMPPPQMIPQAMAMPEEMNQMAAYQQMTMQQPQMQQQHIVKREPDFGRVQYNQNGVPISQTHQRHASMPAYGLEYSPAPSFVSSHYEDYSARGISFEPITPPQQALGMGAEPAYIANEETGLYTAIPDHMGGVNGLHTMMQLPPSNLSGPQFSHAARGYPSNNVYSVIEGSPTYKQRRRRSSIPPGVASIVAAATAAGQHAHQAHRPSDLRRSISTSVGPVAEGDESGDNSPPGLTYSNQINQMSQHHKDLLDLSRHGTPLSTVEDSPHMNPLSLQQTDFQLNNDDLSGDSPLDHSPRRHMQGPSGVVRRARSATMMELGPYPQKSHSCPIPTCGRLFKRLEHLKRHRRTHDRGDGSEGAYGSYSGEEEEYEGEDHLGPLEDASPNSENGYLPQNMTSNFGGMPNMSMGMVGSGMAAPSQLINTQQLMQQQI
ncbi:STE like transcription factor protein [Rutstroemia sp. NJR-2017a WRK4]|nr:STE like transcription factor protein [Rutstroemia sp. NJR-2017a WRK4]